MTRTPYLPGYTVRRDGDEWVATSRNGQHTLRGRSEGELTVARARLVVELAEDFRDTIREAFKPGQPIC